MLRFTPRYIFYCVLLITTAGQWNCRPDVVEFRAFAGSVEDIRQMLAQAPADSSETVLIFKRNLPDTTLALASGLRLELLDTERLFANEVGNVVPCSTCEELKIDLAEAPRKGDLIARGISTVGPNNILIDVANAVRIRVTCDGRNLKLLPNRTIGLYLPIFGNTALVTAPIQYNGLDVSAGVLNNWSTPVDSLSRAVPIEIVSPQGVLKQGYQLRANTLGWIACGQPVINTSTATNTCARLQRGFDQTNTQVWWVSGNQSVAARMSPLPDDTQAYCLSGTPAGQPARIIAVAKTGLQWWLSDYPFNPENVPLVNISMQPVEEDAILALLRNL
jgi:hypothetical protein